MTVSRDADVRQIAERTADDLFSLIKDDLAEVEKEFTRRVSSHVQIVAEIGKYLQDGGGKRVRPALLLLASRLWGQPATPATIRMAVVVEFIHTATLVHDDIIDGAETRRGRPSVNIRWGNQITVLMGDWLYMMAFELALEERNFEILDILTRLTRQMIEGELIQLTHIGNVHITRPEYFDIVRRKTAYLFSACTEIGGLLGGASTGERQQLRQYGLNLGIAFQLIDDVLDFTSSDHILGKPAGNDLREGKVTLPLIYLVERGDDRTIEMIETVIADGDYRRVTRDDLVRILQGRGAIDRARAEAREYARRACSCLEGIGASPYRDVLYALARFIVERRN